MPSDDLQAFVKDADNAWRDYLGLWLTDAQVDFLDNSRGERPFRGYGSTDANQARRICDQLTSALADLWNLRRVYESRLAKAEATIAAVQESVCRTEACLKGKCEHEYPSDCFRSLRNELRALVDPTTPTEGGKG